MNILNKTVLITGSSQRIGKEIALFFASKNANTIIHYNNSKTEAFKTYDEIKSINSDSMIVKSDLQSVSENINLIKKIIDEFGHIDIIINNASIFNKINLKDTTPEIWDKHLNINLRAPFILSQELKKHLGNNPGKIINLNDWKTTRKSRFAYGVSKYSLSGLTKSLALELAPSIQVNEIALGAILPPSDTKVNDYNKSSISFGPSKRMGKLNEITNVIDMLINNDYITGETINIDGGRHLT
ncbi:MAG: KR domain protein [Chloroflexi bacterium]|nr:KR domain protein [Chloroflexota bacterium]